MALSERRLSLSLSLLVKANKSVRVPKAYSSQEVDTTLQIGGGTGTDDTTLLKVVEPSSFGAAG